MNDKVGIALGVACAITIAAVIIPAVGAGLPDSAATAEEGPLVCPIATDDHSFIHGVDPTDVAPLVTDWINDNPIGKWPKHSESSESKDTAAVAALVKADVFTPMGCDDAKIDYLTRLVVIDSYSEWRRAFDVEKYVPPTTEHEGPSDMDGNAKCRVGFGTGGFFWSCSVST